MIRSTIVAGILAFAFGSAASAATITVNTTFNPGPLAPFALNTIAIAPVTIGTGDTLDMTIDFTGGPVTIGGGALWFGLLTSGADVLQAQSLLTFTGNSANLPGSIGPISQENAAVHVGSYFFDVANGSGPFSFATARMQTLVLAAPAGPRAYDSAFFYFESTITPGVIPEPASWALMIAGFGLVGASVRRRTAAMA